MRGLTLTAVATLSALAGACTTRTATEAGVDVLSYGDRGGQDIPVSDTLLRDVQGIADVTDVSDATADVPVDAIAPGSDGASTSHDPLGPTAPASHNWQLTFSDEFDDAMGMSGPTHGLQPSKWNSGWYTRGIAATSQPVSTGEAQWYGPEGIVFPGDGSVHLRLFANHSTTYNKDYESGCITTIGHFGFSASSVRTVLESRIRLPGPNSQAQGYWPAYWLLSVQDGPGGTGQWPPEIDIFELFGNSNHPVAHLHTTGTDINYGLNDSNGTTDLSLAFHTYTLDLSSTALAFYLDGAQQWTYTNTTVIANLFAHDPMYALLNMQFGGAAGTPTGTVPNEMVIDYFRAWQLH